MTQDQPPVPQSNGTPAASLCVLRKRSEFLAVARGQRIPAGSFMLQARKQGSASHTGIRVGFTCSKKVGNAVARNRAKRRLREIARLVLPTAGQPGWDYVLIGRAEHTASRDFVALQQDLKRALKRVHG